MGQTSADVKQVKTVMTMLSIFLVNLHLWVLLELERFVSDWLDSSTIAPVWFCSCHLMWCGIQLEQWLPKCESRPSVMHTKTICMSIVYLDQLVIYCNFESSKRFHYKDVSNLSIWIILGNAYFYLYVSKSQKLPLFDQVRPLVMRSQGIPVIPFPSSVIIQQKSNFCLIA